MKTATITWIFYNNYGTELQAYALQTLIKKAGYENKILWDEYILYPDRNEQQDNINENINHKSFLRKIFFYLIHPREIFGRIDLIIRKKRIEAHSQSEQLFNNFKKKELDIDYEVNINNISEIGRKYDTYICGSDQIWSIIDRNFNGYYFLNFTDKKKISYATSIGNDNIPEEKKKIMSLWIKDFFSISVREEKSANQLSNILNRKVEFVADPTLLFDDLFWDNFCKNTQINKKHYLLCYFLENKEWYFKYAEMLSKKLHLQLVLVPNIYEFTKKNYCTNFPVGPKEFVSLFSNADYVLTDSYHGSIFSLIFNKQFSYLKRFEDNDPECQNIRINSLFSYLNINNIIVSKSENKKDITEYINYIDVNEKLNGFRKKSIEFLKNSLYENCK